MKYDLAITAFCQVGNKSRYDIAVKSFTSLFDSDLSLCGKIVISDDGSTDERFLSLLHFLDESIPKVKVIFNPDRAFETHGLEANAYKALEGCESECAIRLSEDIIFHPTWMQQLSALQTKVEEGLREDWGSLSVTNWGISPLYPDAKIMQEEVVKRSVCGNMACAYKRSIWMERFPSLQRYLSEIHENRWREQDYSYEWAYVDECFRRGLYSFTTETSFAKHLLRNSKERRSCFEGQVLNYVTNEENPIERHLASNAMIRYGTPITKENELLLDHGKPMQDPPDPFLATFIKKRLNAVERIASKDFVSPLTANAMREGNLRQACW